MAPQRQFKHECSKHGIETCTCFRPGPKPGWRSTDVLYHRCRVDERLTFRSRRIPKAEVVAVLRVRR